MKRCRYIVFLLLAGMVGQGCSSRALHEAEAVVAQADSLWQAGLMYGIDAGDSLTLAQAYETLGDIPLPFRTLLGVGSSDSYAHACYHYGKLLRAKDNPAEAMRCFINATHSRTRDYHILGRVYSNMGSICHLAGDFPLSYDMYEKSANCFLADNDSLSYYFLLNDMAFELAEQGQKDSCFNIIANIKNHASYDSVLLAYCWITQAQACLKCKQYDSLIFYAQQSKQIASTLPSSSLQLAQAYSYLGERDSATYYALLVLNNTNELFDVNNALYILTNDDMSKDNAAIRETAAARSDTQKILEIRQGKMSQAVQLLEQDLERKPNLNWLYAIITTLLIVAIVLGVIINKRRKAQKLLSQQRSEYSRKRQDDLEISCKALHNSVNLKNDIEWDNYEVFCNIANARLGGIVDKLKSYPNITPGEVKLCVLVLLDLPYQDIANMLNLSVKSIAKLKSIAAKKIGVTMKELHPKLIQIASSEAGN